MEIDKLLSIETSTAALSLDVQGSNRGMGTKNLNIATYLTSFIYNTCQIIYSNLLDY
jgi:hypothetical protein